MLAVSVDRISWAKIVILINTCKKKLKNILKSVEQNSNRFVIIKNIIRKF